MISLVDVLPTLIEAAGGTPPQDIDGRSFTEVLTGNSEDLRDSIFTTHSGDGKMNRYPMRSVRTRDWKYIRNLRAESKHTTHIDLGEAIDGNEYWNSWVAKAKSDSKAAAIVSQYHRRPAEELYDLRNDPLEQHNLAVDGDSAAVLNQMRSQLDAWMQSQHDRGRATEDFLKTP
jgi:N-sulfoglucosamine sulfohydrolase